MWALAPRAITGNPENGLDGCESCSATLLVSLDKRARRGCSKNPSRWFLLVDRTGELVRWSLGGFPRDGCDQTHALHLPVMHCLLVDLQALFQPSSVRNCDLFYDLVSTKVPIKLDDS